MRRMGLDDKQLTPRVVLSQNLLGQESHDRSAGVSTCSSSDPISERIAHIFEAYRKELRKANALDFDDLLLEAVRLLKSSAEVRERYNRRYRYLLIDEYQDTNRPQYELMKLLAGADKNVCVVGDEDQSIYSWRGADIATFSSSRKTFPSVKTIRLEQNYRSTQIILEAAAAVVARNAQRKGKHLWTAREGGALIGYYEAPDGENEALFVADNIQKYLRKAGEIDELPRVRRALSHQLAVAAGGRGAAPLRHHATPWSAASPSTSAPRSRTCSATSSWCRTPAIRSRCSG